MKKQRNDLFNISRQKFWPALGILAVLLTALPYFLLWEDAIYTYQDQLDGEMIAYILQAKHLFRGSLLPEFMNGASKNVLPPPHRLPCFCFYRGITVAPLLL
ncbi:MAG: DUF6044 family protein [Butyrivibrio sp.]|nr:DUF6044 family protein [Acetatifactor muris]MCM1559295.1 DUF6044 family protein [Butyrivibrio sp.]